MSLRLLNFIFSLYRFLAFTPPSIHAGDASIWQKSYSLLTIPPMLAAIAVSLVNRNFYRDFFHIKATVCVLIDVGLLLFHLCIVLDANFLKVEQWSALIGNLKRQSRVSGKGRSKKYPFFFGFVVAQIHYLGTIAVAAYAWASVAGFDYMGGYGILLVQFYLVYSYNFLLCVLINILVSRFKRLGDALARRLKEIRTGKRTKIGGLSDEFAHFQRIFCDLKASVDLFNDIFGWPIAFIVVLSGLHLLNNLHYIFMTLGFIPAGFLLWKLVLSTTLHLTTVLVSTVAMVFLSDRLSREAENIVKISLQMAWLLKDTSDKSTLKNFTKFVLSNFPSISAARFFCVNRSTILDVLGAVLPTIIILIQFETSMVDLK